MEFTTSAVYTWASAVVSAVAVLSAGGDEHAAMINEPFVNGIVLAALMYISIDVSGGHVYVKILFFPPPVCLNEKKILGASLFFPLPFLPLPLLLFLLPRQTLTLYWSYQHKVQMSCSGFQ